MSTGTWQRIERGDEVEMASLVTAADALWGDAAVVEDLLAGRDPVFAAAERRLVQGDGTDDDRRAIRDEITRLQDRIDAEGLRTRAVEGVLELIVALRGDVSDLPREARDALAYLVGAIDALGRKAGVQDYVDPIEDDALAELPETSTDATTERHRRLVEAPTQRQFAQAAQGGATESQTGTVDKPPATSGYDPDEG